MQDERVAAAVPGATAAVPGSVGLIDRRASRLPPRRSIFDAIFAGIGEVAEDDDDPTHPRAGWYADPGGEPGLLRYWNGAEWTEHEHEIPDHNRMAPPDAVRRRRRRPRRTRRRR